MKMETPELNVVRFSAEDVIATSDPAYCTFYTVGDVSTSGVLVGMHAHTGNEISAYSPSGYAFDTPVYYTYYEGDGLRPSPNPSSITTDYGRAPNTWYHATDTAGYLWKECTCEDHLWASN